MSTWYRRRLKRTGKLFIQRRGRAREVNLLLSNDWELSQQSRTIRGLREGLEALAGVLQSLSEAAENSSIDLASFKVQQRGRCDLAEARRVVKAAQEGARPPPKMVGWLQEGRKWRMTGILRPYEVYESRRGMRLLKRI